LAEDSYEIGELVHRKGFNNDRQRELDTKTKRGVRNSQGEKKMPFGERGSDACLYFRGGPKETLSPTGRHWNKNGRDQEGADVREGFGDFMGVEVIGGRRTGERLNKLLGVSTGEKQRVTN